MLKDLILQNRSRRRFHQKPVERETLRELIDLARLSASGGNRQALKFIIVCDEDTNARIFPIIGLAGNPTQDEAPTAHIVILGDTEISKSYGCDHGIAAQSIMLGATEKGLGGCMVGMVDRKRLRKLLDIPERYEILLLLILGWPKEKPVIDTLSADGNTQGTWDDEGVRHVPKRSLDELIIN
jgi:nitroreductase